MFYTVMNPSGHLKNTLMFSNVCQVLAQYKTRLGFLYLLIKICYRIFCHKVEAYVGDCLPVQQPIPIWGITLMY
jgi:hypothetical protein